MAADPADRMLRRVATVVALLAVVLVWPLSHSLADPAAEQALKATYLSKFGPFVDWPPGALGAPQAPFNLCVIGVDPFGDTLDHAVAGQTVGGRPIVVKRIPVAAASPACAIAFVAGSPKQSVAEALHVLGAAAILTVTDGTDPPGVVNFVVDQGHVKFRFDVQAAAEHGLTIRSQLLDLAVSVGGGKP
jgi:hypothetical protein